MKKTVTFEKLWNYLNGKNLFFTLRFTKFNLISIYYDYKYDSGHF